MRARPALTCVFSFMIDLLFCRVFSGRLLAGLPPCIQQLIVVADDDDAGLQMGANTQTGLVMVADRNRAGLNGGFDFHDSPSLFGLGGLCSASTDPLLIHATTG